MDYEKLLQRIKESQEKPVSTAATEVLNQQARSQALQSVKDTVLAGLGLGLATRGVSGVTSLMHRNMREKPKPLRATVIPLPYIQRKEDEEEKHASVTDILTGKTQTRPGSIPWKLPAAVIGAGLAGLGGWHAVDALLDERRKQEQDDELRGMEQKFNQMLVNRQLEASGRNKKASDDLFEKIGEALDQLCDKAEKQGFSISDWIPDGNTVGSGLGMYGTYAGLTGLAAGAAAYNLGKKTQRRAVLEKALKRRARKLQQMQPPETYALPVPVEVEEDE